MDEKANMKKVPKSMSFRACIYPSREEEGYFVAHCLELDVMGESTTVEGAMDQLLELIESQLNSCQVNDVDIFFPAPAYVWQIYSQAVKAKRMISPELTERVVSNANKRLGYVVPDRLLGGVVGTKEVPAECLVTT